MMPMNNEKIGPQHLGRGARVYVRQSTLDKCAITTRVVVGSMNWQSDPVH